MILRSFLLMLALLSSGWANSADRCDNKQHAVGKIINSLGSRLEQLIESKENYFFSPLSISVALGMVYIGARGTTREQMSEALNFNIAGKNCVSSKISQSFQELLISLEKESEEYALFIANGAFVQLGYKISEFYSSNLEKYYNAKVRSLDFANEATATLETINDWVGNYTRGKIVKLLKEPLDPLTVMILINAVYFKGLWDVQFNENDTKNYLFKRINGSAKDVPFMYLENEFHYYFDEDKGYHFLELEYVGRNTSMIIVLPKNIKEFPQLTLTNELLCNLRDKFEPKSVTVWLPKFSMAFQRELSKDMIKMGMDELFSERADLSGIREDLHVSLMVHKAVIEVNEKGTEASGITGIGIDGRKRELEKKQFRADHPFLFYIVHKGTDTILFSGRVVDP